MSLLTVKNLRTSFHTRNGVTVAVDNINFSIEPGKTLGIVGESGSGKSVTCYSILGLVPSPPGKIESGEAYFDGKDLLQLNEKALRKVRGNRISMIFQDPMTSLNPYMRVGDQLIEPLVLHGGLSKKAARAKAIEALKEVGINDVSKRIDNYPHEFSGGMRQRVMIAMALVTEPELLIADEPTTALDVTVQAQILELLADLQRKHNLAIIFITHDLGVIANIADHILVMKKGEVVEEGSPEHIFLHQRHPYTKKLIGAIPKTGKPQANKLPDHARDILQVNKLTTTFPIYTGAIFKKIKTHFTAVSDVSLTIREGEILGLVGESGSGKSTLGRSIIRLIEAQSGEVLLRGQDLRNLERKALKTARREFQMIFQDPYASLNPRMTVFDTLAEPLKLFNKTNESNSSLLQQVNSLMDDVGLDRKFIKKYPHEFSGGQRQRIAIARALALKPKLIIADEPVSALDVTIQSQILDLLLDLTYKHKLTMLFISHDLSVVRYLCDRVAVMQFGNLVEVGDTEALFNGPQHPYTQELLSAIPKAPAA